MATFRLQPEAPRGAVVPSSRPAGLDGAVLLQNALWFTRIRWVVVVVFAGFGAVSNLFPDALRALGIRPPALWPWTLAAIIALGNAGILAWLHRLTPKTALPWIRCSIWAQILIDLLVLTTLIGLVGPLDTVAPFAYLFHIALACIFFARFESLLVTTLSALLFLGISLLEAAGCLPAQSVLMRAADHRPDAVSFFTTFVPMVFIWFVLWYLISTISEAVRQRDRELEEANQRLRMADEERNRQVLRVTHDLKAPFVGIETSIAILRSNHWETIPEDVRRIIGRIEARGVTLRTRIRDILTLGNLRAGAGEGTGPASPVSLDALLAEVIQDLQGLAARRNITVKLRASPGACVRCNAQPLTILFSNLVANAVSYSKEGTSVEVEVSRGARILARVVDHGIGISPEALPRIFEDYYRAREAAQFSPEGTGLGLAIVRQVVQNLGLTLTVNSREGEGTTFEVVFPEERSVSHGSDHGH